MRRGERGFSLLELIVTLIVASIMGAVFVQFAGSALTGSVRSVVAIQQQAYLNQIVENMGADYKKLLSESASPLGVLVSRIGSENTTQTYYADAQHPYRVVTNHRISFPSSNPATEQADGAGRIQRVTLRYPDTADGFTLTVLFGQ